jgi:hypothetical protein
MVVLQLARSAVSTNSPTNCEWDAKIVKDTQVAHTYGPVILYINVYK